MAQPFVCPFCGVPGLFRAEGPERCLRCNLYVTRSASEGSPLALDSESRDFCPWCAWPVARELSLFGGPFRCPGCAGSLSPEVLETQAAIDDYRKRALSSRGHLAFFVVLALILAALYGFAAC